MVDAADVCIHGGGRRVCVCVNRCMCAFIGQGVVCGLQNEEDGGGDFE